MGDKELRPNEDIFDEAAVASTLAGMASMFLMEIPGTDYVTRIRSDEYKDALHALSRDEGIDNDIRSGAAEMLEFIDTSSDKDIEDIVVLLGVDRTKVYRGISPEYGAPYPAEAVWKGLDGVEAAKYVEELVSEYRSMGIAPSAELRERPDYLGVQLDSLRFVLDKAIRTGDADQVEEAFALVRRFCASHFWWVDEFAEKAQEHTKTKYLQGHILLTKGVCRQLSKI